MTKNKVTARIAKNMAYRLGKAEDIRLAELKEHFGAEEEIPDSLKLLGTATMQHLVLIQYMAAEFAAQFDLTSQSFLVGYQNFKSEFKLMNVSTEKAVKLYNQPAEELVDPSGVVLLRTGLGARPIEKLYLTRKRGSITTTKQRVKFNVKGTV